MPKANKYSKNVTLKGRNIECIEAFMHKTRKNFSATLNIIIEQWDTLTLEIIKQQRTQAVDNIKQAKVLKE